MSINTALLAGVSGLTANASALASISQNIANVNTIGYKRTQTDFSTVVNTQTNGVSYSAGGVMANTRNFISQSGQLQRTSSTTDLGISGSGFFVTTEKPEGLDAGDTRLFTRAGAFRVNEFGYLKNTAGLYLQGWPVDAEGVVSSDPSDLTRMRSINVGSVGGAAEATTRAQLNANLQSSQELSAEAAAAAAYAADPADPAGAGRYDPATNSMSMYDAETGDGVKPDFDITIPVSDSKGGQRTVALSLLKAEEANQWYAEIRAVPASDVENGSTPANGQMRTGMVLFTQDGRLDVQGMKDMAAAYALDPTQPRPLFDDPEAASISFGASNSAVTPTATAVKWSDDLGISAQTVSLDLSAAAGGLTQYDEDSEIQSVETNGTAFGNLASVQIDEEGFVTAIFDNGVTRKIAQVALATFPSPDSLTSVNGNAYQVSQGSGTYNLKAPGTGGSGMIGASQLEASTVDLSAEFTGLITTQRAYSASSKIITTADEMLAELISIKR